MNIDIEKVKDLVGEADLILIKPEAENVLLQLLDLKDQIEAAIDEAEKKIEEAALRINPTFKSIRSDNLKVTYREYGAKYYVDESQLELAPKELYRTEIKVIAANGMENTDLKATLKKNLGWDVKVSEKTDGTLKDEINRAVDAKAVSKWVKDHKAMPTGIIEDKNRTKSLSFSRRTKQQHEAESEE